MLGPNLSAAARRLSRTTVTAGLAAAAGLAMIAAPITAHAAAPPRGCTGPSCILDLEVQPDGMALGVVVDTGVDTVAEISVYKAGKLVGQATDSWYRKAHTVRTGNTLAVNTSYTWHVAVTDAQGNRVERTGEASTLHRRVTVQFQSVTVTNDSDDSGAGEFRTYVAIPGARAIPPLTPESINSGETKLLGAVLQQRDAGATTLIQTEMFDDDTWFTAPSPYPSLADATFAAKSKGPWSEFATASGSVNTSTASPGPIPFQISVNSYVGFVVHGTYSVDYVS